METILNDIRADFEKEVLSQEIPVLVDFWATWCGPCRMIAPDVEEISNEYAGKIKVCKANVDETPELAQSFGIQFIPTLIAFKDGKEISRLVGLKTKDEILGMFSAEEK